MKRLLILLAFVATTYAHAQEASFYTGNTLMEKCEDNDMLLLCAGYISGVVDGIARVQHVENLSVEFPACVPEEVTNWQLRAVVVKFMEDNPAKRHFAAAGIIQNAVHDAFPCD